MDQSRIAGVGAVAGGMFVRKSSGLVRTVTTLDTLLYCILQIAIPYVMFNFAVYGLYPGASMELATIIAIVGSVGLGITYALFSSVYPRSGGEYVFLSRTAHPFIGFVVSFVVTFWQMYYTGVNGAFAATIGIAPLFTILGWQTENASLIGVGQFFDSPWGWFLVGAVVIAFFTAQLYVGMRTYFKYQKWVLSLALLGYLIFILTLVLGTVGVFDFKTNLEAISGQGAYQNLIDTASSQGLVLTPRISISSTMAFVIWPAFSFLFAVLSVAFSGEIKNVKRGQLYGIVGANLIAGTLLLLVSYFGRMAIGDAFVKAASFLGAIDPLPYPWLTLLASVLGGNVLLTLIINLAMVLLLVYTIASAFIYATRGAFAWAIDGMAPSKLAEVSERYHTPTYTILLAVVVGLASLALYSFTDYMRIISGIIPFGIAFMIVAFFGMLFPYIKREVYQASPAKIEIAGVPLMTITGFIATLITAFVVYLAFVDDTYAANSTFSMWMIVIVFAVAAIWYFVARWVRSRQGVDMNALYKEIPIE